MNEIFILICDLFPSQFVLKAEDEEISRLAMSPQPNFLNRESPELWD